VVIPAPLNLYDGFNFLLFPVKIKLCPVLIKSILVDFHHLFIALILEIIYVCDDTFLVVFFAYYLRR